MDEHKYTFEQQTFQHLHPIALTMGSLSCVVFLVAVLLGQYIVGTQTPELYLYSGTGIASAVLLWRAKTLDQLWLGGTGGMVAAAAGYSTLVSTLSNPDLWFFSTGLSLTFAVIVSFHNVWHYLVSTTLVWVAAIAVSRPTFTTPFDYALGILVVTAAVGVGMFTIILMRKARLQSYELQQKLHQLAHRDALTNLPNRRAFMEGLHRAASACPQDLHLLMLDIDDFKRINDSLGHEVGDQALIAAGATLTEHARALTYGRMGGEEFAAAGPMNPSQAHRLAQDLVQAMHTIVIEDRRLSISIGLVRMQPGETPSQLLRRADEAMYLAKHAGKNQYQAL